MKNAIKERVVTVSESTDNWAALAREIITCIRLFESDRTRLLPESVRNDALCALRLALAAARFAEAHLQ